MKGGDKERKWSSRNGASPQTKIYKKKRKMKCADSGGSGIISRLVTPKN